MAGVQEVPRRSSRMKFHCQRDGGRAAVSAQGKNYYLRAKRPKFCRKMAGDEEVPRPSSRMKPHCRRDGGRAAVRAPKFCHKMPRAKWTVPRIRRLLQLVIREKNLFNWNGSGRTLTRLGWSNVCPDFRRKTRLNYDVRKLQSKLRAIKSRYFYCLLLQANGNERYIRKHPPCLDFMFTIFGCSPPADFMKPLRPHFRDPHFRDLLNKLFVPRDSGAMMHGGGGRDSPDSMQGSN